jgi:hypothetical protein
MVTQRCHQLLQALVGGLSLAVRASGCKGSGSTDAGGTNTCSVDPAVDCSPTIGYSCSGNDAPSDDFPGLVCGTPTANQGKNLYCCRM